MGSGTASGIVGLSPPIPKNLLRLTPDTLEQRGAQLVQAATADENSLFGADLKQTAKTLRQAVV